MNLFFFSDLFVRRFQHNYADEIEPSKMKLRYTIPSVETKNKLTIELFEKEWKPELLDDLEA